MLEVRLQLLCTKKPGTLSRVIREINMVGLHYVNHRIENDDDYSRITINANGDMNCSPESFREFFDDFPGVLGVQELSVSRGGKEVTEVRTRVSDTRLSAKDQITPAIVLSAEKRLADILGPVASLIVASVADNCANVGQLYVRLAEELNDDEERRQFLSVIEKWK